MVTLLQVIPGNAKHRRAVYRCECGVEFVAEVSNVKSGHTKSCGCFRRVVTTERSRKHGHKTATRRTKVYTAWLNMKARCTNENSRDYKNYGGRGISYDPRWESFEHFLEDMGEPGPGMTLDRINNMGNYSKDNCRWASRSMQSQNKRNCKFYEFNGQSKTLGEWAKETGIGRVTLIKRIQRGVPVEIALTTTGFLKKAT